jgi:hypothetical protein
MDDRASSKTIDRRQQGGALVFVLIAMAALLFVAVLSTQIGISDRRSTIRAAHAKNAFACAETALERGRVVVAANWFSRNCALQEPTPSCTWLPIEGDCPGPGGYTYNVEVRDNVDEFAGDAGVAPDGGFNNPQRDDDETVILDAVVLQGTTPVLQTNALMNALPGTGPNMWDYDDQDRLGGRKLGHKGN